MSPTKMTPVTAPNPDVRARITSHLAYHLEHASHPRAQMALMVSATGSAGFFIDRLLLKAGVYRMSLRYALAVGLAYVVFLGLIKVWLVFHYRRKARQGGRSSGSGWGVDLSSGSSGSGGGSGSGSSFLGGGGSSGGGGASASFGDEGEAQIVPVPVQSGGGSHFLDSAGGGGGGGDETVAVIAVVVAVAGAFLAAAYLVLHAPVIFGDVLVDGSLSAGLYKRLKTLDHHSWLETAVRETIIPFAVVALLVGVAGHFAQKAFPEAHSIGAVLHHWTL